MARSEQCVGRPTLDIDRLGQALDRWMNPMPAESRVEPRPELPPQWAKGADYVNQSAARIALPIQPDQLIRLPFARLRRAAFYDSNLSHPSSDRDRRSPRNDDPKDGIP